MSADHIAEEALRFPMDWEEGGHVHNWRTHVGPHVRALWDTLASEVKIAIAKDADEQAGAEEWD